MNHIPTIRKMCLVAILLLGGLHLHAQVDKALKLIEDGKLDGVEAMLRAGLADEKDRVFAYYGLARLYATSEFPSFQLDSAYSHAAAAEEAYKALSSQDKGKVSKDLNTSEIRKLRTAIVKTALEKAEGENTQEAYQYFLDHYPDPGARYESSAMAARNQMAYEKVKAADTEAAYNELLDTYGPDLKAKNRALYDAAQKRQFELVLERRGWAGYHEIAEKYPDHIYVRDSLFENFKALWYGPATDYYDFIQAHPNAPITKFAIDSLGGRLSESADPTLTPYFLKEYPDHPAHDAVYAALYESLKKRFQSMTDLEEFKTAHPDFPYPERFADDAEIFLDRSYEKLEVGKALGAFRAFIDKYPNYSRIDSVWMRYYQTFKMQMPGPDNLDKFGKAHPNFPFPQVLEADKQQFQKGAEDDAWLQIRSNGSIPDLFRYIKTHQKSPYRADAIDLLAGRLLEEGQEQPLAGFLKEYPAHELRPELLEKLWEVFSGKDNAKAIAAFQAEWPDFPKPKMLETALANAPPSDGEVQEFREELRTGFVNYIRHHAPEGKAFEALWRMLESDFAREDWDAAYSNMSAFQESFGDHCSEYAQWLRILDPQNRVRSESISPLINTNLEEYSAVIAADDQSIYFCRNMDTGSATIDEDVYVARRDAKGSWQAAQPIKELNTEGNEAPEAVSADGNRMLIFVDGQICSSEKTRNGWSEPLPLPDKINRSFWQADARIAADGRAILFAAEAGFLRGNKDIYVSLLQEDGSWGTAIPLGDNINTGTDDRSPFLHPDMKTLYFSSGGHRGFGGLDIFMSKRLDDSWTNWSKPVNLGPGVNTTKGDWSFKVTTDGRQGYYNILSDETGGDIFLMPLPEAFQPEPVATVSGKLTGIGGEPVGAQINWTDLESGEVIQITASDPVTGAFFATLPSLGQYGYTIRKEDYFPVSGHLDFTEKLFHQRLDKAMTVVTIAEMKEKDLAVPLNNLFFETAKYDIRPTSYPELDGLAAWLAGNDLSIEIHGHTDTVGDDAGNLLLSENRARAVRDYLLAKGLNEQRLIAKGFGENRPIAGNDTDEDRAMNRRVEIRIR